MAGGMLDFVKDAPPTLRTLLGACARLYDPQGLLAPYVMVLKLVLQDAHSSKAGWDTALEPELQRRWQAWCTELHRLDDFRLPRCLEMNPNKVSDFELHAFSDASERAYAAVVYLKSISYVGGVTTSLIACKSKLAPFKQPESLTIPKKELMAATLATRLARKLQTHLRLKKYPIHFWADSQVVLH